jgi:hypothetical protein
MEIKSGKSWNKIRSVAYLQQNFPIQQYILLLPTKFGLRKVLLKSYHLIVGSFSSNLSIWQKAFAIKETIP